MNRPRRAPRRLRFLTSAALALIICHLGAPAIAMAQNVCDDIANNTDGLAISYHFDEPGTSDPLFTTCPNMIAGMPVILHTGDLTAWNVVEGQTYTWSNCGSVDWDSYMRLWNGADFALVAQNDDDPGCVAAPRSSRVTWTATFTGEVWLGVTEFECNLPTPPLSYNLHAECAPRDSDADGIPDDEDECPGFELAGTPCGDAGSTCLAQDTCDGAGTCIDNGFVNEGAPCDDGNPCTTSETCAAGSCQGVQVDCGDGTCVPSTGECGPKDSDLDGIPDDQDECPGFEQVGTPCGDPSSTPCSDPDTCDGQGNCLANDLPVGTGCDDADPCTPTDACSAGVCVGTPVDCIWPGRTCDPANGLCIGSNEWCADITKNTTETSMTYAFDEPGTTDPIFTTCPNVIDGMPVILHTGELTLWNVVEGNTYTWSNCGTADWDSHMRLWNADDLSLIGDFDDDPSCTQAPLTSRITWQATFTGQVWVGAAVHEDGNLHCTLPEPALSYNLRVECSTSATDSDGDGIPDDIDECPGFEQPGTACGDAGSQCVVQDTCDGAGHCIDNGFVAIGTACDDASPCTSSDACFIGACAGVPVDCGAGSCDPQSGACVGGDLLCVAADDADLLLGSMTSDAQFTGGSDLDPTGDSFSSAMLYANSAVNAFNGGSGDEAHYTIDLPDQGPWYLWGRFYYPGAPGSNDANSFFAAVDGGPASKFGNNRDFFQRFHWDGNGAVERGAPASLPLGTLAAGAHSIAIGKREVVPGTAPPRLDVLCVSTDGAAAPDDEAVAAILGLPSCVSDTACDDDDPCTTDDSCTAGVCVGLPVDCGNQTCDPASGQCIDTTVDTDGDGIPDDLDECPGFEQAGTPCGDAGSPCVLQDTCDGAGRCVDNGFVATGTACHDENACTTADTCAAGSCIGVPVDCGAGMTCDPTSGACIVGDLVCVAADQADALLGNMTTSTQFAGGADADAGGDSLAESLTYANSTTNSNNGGSGDEAHYSIDVPDTGPWYLWGRFYYPGAIGSNDANSFFVRVDGGTLSKLGNNRDFFQRFHWDGDGNLESGPPTPIALGALAAGTHSIVVEKREVRPAGSQPRLDVLCLSRDAAAPPDDVDVATLIGPAETCLFDFDCDDGNACTTDSCDTVAGCSHQALVCPTGQSCNPTTGACTAPPTVCIAAGSDPTAVFSGAMTTGLDYTGGADNDPAADNLTSPLVFPDSATNSLSPTSNATVSYLVELPEDGPWFLWGRLYYPGAVGSNDANSFFASIDGGASAKFGNNKGFFQRWHWDGNGNVEVGAPAGLPLPGVGAGTHEIVIRQREVLPVGKQPRLDVLCFTKSGDVPPSDADF